MAPIGESRRGAFERLLSSRLLLFAVDHATYRNVGALLLLLEAVLLHLIIQRVPYTEIDWVTYMQQIQQVVDGERDYGKIGGDTGPLVYPAGHVYLYRLLYRLTDGGSDVQLAQYIFAGFYLATLGLTIAAYRASRVPVYVLPLLCLSKRLHSIYVLRLFNDGPCAMFLALAHFFAARRQLSRSVAAYSVALSIKMGALLYLPALGLLLVIGSGPRNAVKHLLVVVELQLLIGAPFLLRNPSAYLAGAFNFGRAFLWKWTVNWRWVGRDVFESREFSVALLALHLGLLVFFAATRWVAPARRSLPEIVRAVVVAILMWPVDSYNSLFARRRSDGGEGDEDDVDGSTSASLAAAAKRGRPLTPSGTRLLSDHAYTTMVASNLIGVLCARSLHYQFYAWFAWTLPFAAVVATCSVRDVELLRRGVVRESTTYSISSEDSEPEAEALTSATEPAVKLSKSADRLDLDGESNVDDSDGISHGSGSRAEVHRQIDLDHMLRLARIVLPRVLLLVALEWAWLTFPSTRASSATHCAALVVLLGWIWLAQADRPAALVEDVARSDKPFVRRSRSTAKRRRHRSRVHQE